MTKHSPAVLPSGPEGKKTWGARATDAVATVYAGLSQMVNGSDPNVEFEAARVAMWRAGKTAKTALNNVRKLAA
ncbi:MAG: hypothetical protein AAF213_03865 [Pseudomonadota bacterium]